MKELEKIVDSNGEPLEIVDAEAREDISEIKQSLSRSQNIQSQVLAGASWYTQTGICCISFYGISLTANNFSDLPSPNAYVVIPLYSGNAGVVAAIQYNNGAWSIVRYHQTATTGYGYGFFMI